MDAAAAAVSADHMVASEIDERPCAHEYTNSQAFKYAFVLNCWSQLLAHVKDAGSFRNLENLNL